MVGYLALREMEVGYNKKPAVRSVSVWGSITSIGSLLALVATLREFWDSIPPELIDDTRAWFLAAGVLIGQLMSLIGRWKARSEVSGIFRVKK